MYESPIMAMVSDIITEIRQEQDRKIMNAILSVGINVDKNELVKALSYDRQQYDKGYSEGYAAGQADISRWISVEERLPKIGEIVLAYVEELGLIIRAKIVDAKDYRGERRIDWARVDPDPFFLSCYTITHWMPLPEPPTPKGVE